MKYYIAARSAKQEDVWRIYEKLEALGHHVTFKWPIKTDFVRPFRGTSDNSTIEHAKKDLFGAADADVFVLLSEKDMRGTYVELGAYLVSKLKANKQPQINVIELEPVDEHIFESFKNTKIYSTVKEFIESLK